MQSRNAWLGYVNLPGCSRGWVKCCYFFSTQGEAKLQVTNTAQGQLLGINLDFLVWCLLLCPAFCEPDLFLVCHKNFVCKCCSVKIHLLERSCLGLSLNEWCQVCGYCWLFRICFNFFKPLYCVQAERLGLCRVKYRWPGRGGFLAVLALISAFLFPSSPCRASENVVMLCFASRNHRFTLILFFWCLAVSGGWLGGQMPFSWAGSLLGKVCSCYKGHLSSP